MAAPGRKSWVKEMELGRRYSRLTEPVFKVIDEMLNSDDKADKKWAVEQMQKAFVKMIPQDITSGGEKLTYSDEQIEAIIAARAARNTSA